jgi:hypothetical protein
MLLSHNVMQRKKNSNTLKQGCRRMNFAGEIRTETIRRVLTRVPHCQHLSSSRSLLVWSAETEAAVLGTISKRQTAGDFIQQCFPCRKRKLIEGSIWNTLRVIGVTIDEKEDPYTLLLDGEMLRELWNRDIPVQLLSKRWRDALLGGISGDVTGVTLV